MQTCQIANSTRQLSSQMQVLQAAVKRVSESWNDTVASAISANHINAIIGICNTVNAQLANIGPEIERGLNQLEELAKPNN